MNTFKFDSPNELKEVYLKYQENILEAEWKEKEAFCPICNSYMGETFNFGQCNHCK